MASVVNGIFGRLSVLQRLSIAGGLVLALLVVAGIFGVARMSLQEKPFFVPGRALPNREDCFYDKLAKFKNVNKQIIFQAANECELEIQSLEGHEKMYEAWVQEQAQKAKERAAKKAAEPPPEQPKDRLRRVWQ